MENGVSMSNCKEIEEILRSFSSLYIQVIKEKLFVEGIDWSTISAREDEELVTPFSLEEIRKVAFSCDRNKSPGLDSFFLWSSFRIIGISLKVSWREFLKNSSKEAF